MRIDQQVQGVRRCVVPQRLLPSEDRRPEPARENDCQGLMLGEGQAGRRRRGFGLDLPPVRGLEQTQGGDGVRATDRDRPHDSKMRMRLSRTRRRNDEILVAPEMSRDLGFVELGQRLACSAAVDRLEMRDLGRQPEILPIGEFRDDWPKLGGDDRQRQQARQTQHDQAATCEGR